MKEKRSVDRSSALCPVEAAGSLDSVVRRWFQNPHRILSSYIRGDMTVIDLGCGPGFFTMEMARLLGERGKIIAADIQQGMLDIVKGKIEEHGYENKIETHLCTDSSIGVTAKADFILAFYVIHEMKDQRRVFNELRTVIKQDGLLYISEPKFHVTREKFNTMTETMKECGFIPEHHLGSVLSRVVTARPA